MMTTRHMAIGKTLPFCYRHLPPALPRVSEGRGRVLYVVNLVLAYAISVAFAACAAMLLPIRRPAPYWIVVATQIPVSLLKYSFSVDITFVNVAFFMLYFAIVPMLFWDASVAVRATCAAIVNQFVSNNVDLILANATPALQAAAAATDTIPILGTSITEYGVALQLKDFNGTVGGNISGTSDLAPLDQQAAMVTEWFPEAKNVGLLYCSGEPNSLYQVNEVAKYLKNAGVSTKMYSFADSNDLSAICQTAADESDVIYVPTDNTVASNKTLIDNICRPAKVPVIAGEEGVCSGCGVATLSISYYDLGYTTGKMAIKILKGEADISTMPIEYTSVTKKYNAAICKDLGITPLEGYEPIA